MHMSTMTNSLVTGNLVPADTSFPSLDSYDVILRYQRATGALSISAGGKTQSTTVSGKLSAPYIFLQCTIFWENGSTTVADPPSNMMSVIDFQSMTLPKLDPVIEDVALYREDGTRIGKEDIVAPREKVQVRCTVRNAHASASGQFFPMHVKQANTTAYPTKGLSAFYDSSHPLQVNGATVATANGAGTPTGANGVPITLVGSTPVTVSYWATISGTSGGAVVLSQQLIEDTFQGSKYATTELVAEQSLKPLPDEADPDDPSTWGEAD